MAARRRTRADVASAARDVEQVADAFRLQRFAVMGASGGGPHALACAALLRDRVSAVATLAGIAPYTEAFDWFAGDGRAAGAARRPPGSGRAEALPPEFDENSFTARDWAALEGRWAALGEDAGRAGAAGLTGRSTTISRSPRRGASGSSASRRRCCSRTAARIASYRCRTRGTFCGRLPNAELWLRPRAGHVSILDAVPTALDWLHNWPG